jgi:hypothetical protein
MHGAWNHFGSLPPSLMQQLHKIFKHKKKILSKMSPNLRFSITQKKQFNQKKKKISAMPRILPQSEKRLYNSFLGGFFLALTSYEVG